MDFSELIKNIIDIIKEEQIKLGYRKEEIRLYYPLDSLNRLIKSECNISEMIGMLHAFSKEVIPMFGDVSVTNDADRFCIYLPPKATEYVYHNTEKSGFLYDFIDMISRHGVSIEDILALFQRYSENVHCEKNTTSDFDYLIYFEDGQPDAYWYCLKEEVGHMIYHRYTKADYEQIRREFM